MTEAWLGYGTKLQYGDGGTGSGTQAYATFGTTDSQLVVKAKIAGTSGNGRKATIVASGQNTPLSIVCTKTNLTINVATDGSSSAKSKVGEVISALYLDPTFNEYWQATTGVGDGSGVLAAASETTLAGGTDGTETFSDISEVTELPLPSEEGTEVEATHLNSPNKMREYISGLADGGEIAFTCNFIPSDTSQAAMRTLRRSGAANNFKIIFTTGEYVTFTAFVKAWDAGSASPDGVISATITLKLTGDAVWSN